VFVPAWTSGPLLETGRQIDLVEKMTALAPEMTALAGTARQAAEIRDSGRIAGLMGAEGGHTIENDLTAVPPSTTEAFGT